MTKGRFIVLEGGEGVGKSTQARLLAEALEQAGIAALITREPGGTPGAEAIRSLLLEGPASGADWNPRAEALLFAAARSNHVERLIEPALADGRWVVCDRFIDSSRAYQGGGGGLSDSEILYLHRIGSQGLMPDMTLLLEVPAELAQSRAALRDDGRPDAIGGRTADYHARVAATFRSLADAEPQRFSRIDAQGSPGEVHGRIMAALAPLTGR